MWRKNSKIQPPAIKRKLITNLSSSFTTTFLWISLHKRGKFKPLQNYSALWWRKFTLVREKMELVHDWTSDVESPANCSSRLCTQAYSPSTPSISPYLSTREHLPNYSQPPTINKWKLIKQKKNAALFQYFPPNPIHRHPPATESWKTIQLIKLARFEALGTW